MGLFDYLEEKEIKQLEEEDLKKFQKLVLVLH